ncbi:hypothetical protein ACI2KS_10870 [Pseudomonas sp. NPDC087358]|uniref:hypothetical protein n=1 Tax=Pseudomonas sp. NPDC087358 TaxID=3364439 RepID=UPI00384C6289
MDASPDADWQDDFTREQMLEQQSHLLTMECHMLQKELSRYRKNLAKLIDMHGDVTVERDRLRVELTKTQARLSDCLRENSSLSNRIGGLEGCRDQLAAIHKAQREGPAAALSTKQD